MTDAAVFTIKDLDETDVICAYFTGEKSVRRFWDEPGAHDFSASYAMPWTEFNRIQLGFEPGDAEQIQLAAKQVSGNFPGGGLASKVGWSWLVERDGLRWRVVGERAPGTVGRSLHAERAVSAGESGAEGAERKTAEIGGLRNQA